ncbi:G8 domain-containing protein [Altererythrobacter sp. KTW20L]|uniref:G8 domain-containing protein n=1 Tax=Altererythrobacter sp. KTW20L TaxID=2942210 RepID=UPI0020BF8445|nr:G8 domain-containing protein [Altererythrobacter sp. KTW20L]MCL6249487.1 G8 domain-containing protein [Altererythrobacter sp. KTW20L]
MRLRSSLHITAMLLPATLMLGAGTGVAAQDHHDHMEAAAEAPAAATRTMRWSDAAAWPDGRVPREGDAVVIARDMDVLLDVVPPTLRSLTIDGKLTFSNDLDIELATDWIYLRRGELHIGSEERPHTAKATITLTDNVPGEDINTMGDRGIMLMGGTLSLHGDREHTWSKLSGTAEAGATRIEVLDASGWRVGDEIVLASTDFDPRQAEKRTIAAISGNAITLDRPLQYMHFGEITFGVDQRGEVGLLTRNIRIQASEDSLENNFGGHIMAMLQPDVRVSGVELYRMGQHLTLARYPIHWHLVGEGQGQYIQNSAIHNTFNRCVTVHGTHNVRVENNVTFDTVGHCFFLEDAIETGNQFISNLGIMTKCHPTLPCEPTHLGPAGLASSAPGRGAAGQRSEHILLPSDNTAATFWITNPDNVYRNNVAAGSDMVGFWFALPIHPNGEFLNTEIAANTWPRRTRVREFSGNTSHSNFDGLMFDRGPNPDNTFSVGGSNYHFPTVDPADPNSEPLVSHFADFTAYKNRNGAVWGRGELHLFTNLRVADNAIGFTHAASAVGRAEYTSKVVDSIFVGESDNIGTPTTPAEIAYGRSMPNEIVDFPIRGYEYYDMRHDVENTTFVNFQPNDTRDAGALSYLMYTSFGMSTGNAIEGATFVNSKPVSFPPYVRRWASDLGRGNAWRGASIHDKDGSVGGVPGAFIVLDNGIASDEDACEIRPTWGAAICQGDFGLFNLGGQMGFGGGPIADPIMLSRNGRRWEYTGQTTIRSGADVRVETSRDELALTLTEMDDGSWVIFELPGFSTPAAGAELASLDALREAGETAWFKDGETLWVKLVVDNSAGQTVTIGRLGAGVSTVGPRADGAFDAGANLAVRR